jgi:hypothetical protein
MLDSPKGKSFLGQEDKTINGLKRHLHIIISDQDIDDTCLAVPVETLQKDKDGMPFKSQDLSCVLKSADNLHSFIKQDSWANYSKAKAMTDSEIQEGIQAGLFIIKETVIPDLLLLLQEGARKTLRLPNKLVKFRMLF